MVEFIMHKQQKTKIIATIGPASDSEETIKDMIAAGMSVARINLSFGTDRNFCACGSGFCQCQ